MKKFCVNAFFTGFIALGLTSAVASAQTETPTVGDVHPDGKGNFSLARRGTGINYHGGPILGTTSPTSLYYIWYGNWGGNSATTILTDFANTLGGSPYYNINTSYYNSAKAHITNAITYAGSTNDAYSQGTNLSDTTLQAVVQLALTNGAFPADANAIYMVLTSQDVNETSGFCTQYCGFHTHATMSGVDIKYAFIGNAARCITTCASTNTTISPNGNVGADEMASVIAHEFEEAASDPDLNAWYSTSSGQENADKCAYIYGTEYTTGNGAKANMKLGTRDFLIQQNWLNISPGSCQTSH